MLRPGYRQLSRNQAVAGYGSPFASSILSADIRLHRQPARLKGTRAFMLRIERSANGQVVFTLSGRMQMEDIEQLQQLLGVETPAQSVTFDLRDVTLVNQDAVTFLAGCEANGIKLQNCPLHIRNWINQERRRDKPQSRQRKDT